MSSAVQIGRYCRQQGLFNNGFNCRCCTRTMQVARVGLSHACLKVHRPVIMPKVPYCGLWHTLVSETQGWEKRRKLEGESCRTLTVASDTRAWLEMQIRWHDIWISEPPLHLSWNTQPMTWGGRRCDRLACAYLSGKMWAGGVIMWNSSDRICRKMPRVRWIKSPNHGEACDGEKKGEGGGGERRGLLHYRASRLEQYC